MKKGKRFIFYFWPKKVAACVRSVDDTFIFSGRNSSFFQKPNKVFHFKNYKRKKIELEWEVKDTLKTLIKKILDSDLEYFRFIFNEFNIVAKDENMIAVEPNIISSYTSPDYGILN